MVADRHPVAMILDQTIAALSRFDYEELESLERQIKMLGRASSRIDPVNVGAIGEKKRILASLLKNCDMNLSALKRLHTRNRMEPWLR